MAFATPNAMPAPESANRYKPMFEMNTTPLIDVMLVLLIMFIMTIPIATHSVPIDVGGGGDITLRPDPVVNRIDLTAGDGVLWNGEPVTQPQLVTLLARTRIMPVEPELHFRPDALASYNTAAKVTALIKASGVSNFGFVGNEQFAEFGGR